MCIQIYCSPLHLLVLQWLTQSVFTPLPSKHSQTKKSEPHERWTVWAECLLSKISPSHHIFPLGHRKYVTCHYELVLHNPPATTISYFSNNLTITLMLSAARLTHCATHRATLCCTGELLYHTVQHESYEGQIFCVCLLTHSKYQTKCFTCVDTQDLETHL